MIPLFLGLSVANVAVLCVVFGLGLGAVDAEGGATGPYAQHVAMGIAAGFLATGTHLATYTYFMATARWLQAATDKAGLDERRFVFPALERKKRALKVVMVALSVTMLTMFAGGGADPTAHPWFPGGLHLMLAVAAVGVNLIAAWVEFGLIRQQGAVMDEVLWILNRPLPDPPSLGRAHR